MDKVLKQRLVGASILIALAVIFLPMLFDGGETDRSQRQLTLDLPERPDGAGQEVRRLPLDPDQARQAPPETVAEAPEVVESPEPGREEPESRTEPDSSPGADIDPDQSSPEPETGPVHAEETDPGPDPEPETEPTDIEEATGDWIVQVAVFSNPDTAERIRDRLDGLGHTAAINEMVRDQARLYRLVTGPYGAREEARQARDQITATIAGLDPMVRSAQESVEAEETRERSGYSVQVGSFASRNNAERLVDRLEQQGHDAFMHDEESGGRTIWRVRVGLFDTRDPADSLLEQLREQAGLEGIVVSHP